MDIIPITDLMIDDKYNTIHDIHQIAFYNINNFDIEKIISFSLPYNNFFKYRLINLDSLLKRDDYELPDIVILNEKYDISEEEKEFINSLNIKFYYVSEGILNNRDYLIQTTEEILNSVYKSKVHKAIQIEKQNISSMEKEIENQDLDEKEIVDILIRETLDHIREKDDATYSHVKKVNDYVDIFVDGLDEEEKLSESQIIFLKNAALVHDIGMLVIPNQILKKESKLDKFEYDSIKSHVSEDAYLYENELLQEYKEIALAHHERYDGTGYPNGIKGENIPYFARIISVLDAFEAMTGKRPYVKNQQKKTLYNILDDLNKNSCTQFDPYIVRCFIIGIVNNPEFQISLSEEYGGTLKRLKKKK